MPTISTAGPDRGWGKYLTVVEVSARIYGICAHYSTVEINIYNCRCKVEIVVGLRCGNNWCHKSYKRSRTRLLPSSGFRPLPVGSRPAVSLLRYWPSVTESPSGHPPVLHLFPGLHTSSLQLLARVSLLLSLKTLSGGSAVRPGPRYSCHWKSLCKSFFFSLLWLAIDFYSD